MNIKWKLSDCRLRPLEGKLTDSCFGNSRVLCGRNLKRNSYQLKKEEPMRLAISTFSLVLVAVMAVAATGFQHANAAEQEYKPKAKATSLLEKPLAGVEGKKVIIKHFEFPPGYVGGKHSHPGPVFVYVLEGELTIDTKEAGRQRIRAGKLYQEPIRSVMQARNLSTTDATKIVVFQVGDEGKPMMIKSE